MTDIQPVQAQTYEYDLYVDGFKPWIIQWAVSDILASPWLDAVDSNYIEGTFDGAWMANFTFENITLPPCQAITEVVLEGYTNGPYNPTVDYDVYTLPNFVWLGSLYATGAPAWVTPRYTPSGSNASDLDQTLLTEQGINNLQLLVYFYDPYGSGGPGNTIDALRLKVYTGISATIDFAPNTIIASAGGPPFLRCTITLPASFNASDIDQSSISLDCVIAPYWFGTPTVNTLEVRFNMTDVKYHIANDIFQGGSVGPPPISVTLNVTFSLTPAAGGTPFKGSDNVNFMT